MDHSLTSRLWACWVCRWCIKENFFVGHKSLSFSCWKVSSFKSSLMLARLRKGPPGARLSSWPKWSPFGLRIVVSPLVWLEIAILFFPFEWPVSIHRAPPMSALARGAKLLLWAASQCTLQRILLKKKLFFLNKRHVCYCGWLLDKNNSKVSAAVSRLVLEACSSVVRWLGDHGGSTQAGTKWSEISLRILLTPLVWPENSILFSAYNQGEFWV